MEYYITIYYKQHIKGPIIFYEPSNYGHHVNNILMSLFTDLSKEKMSYAHFQHNSVATHNAGNSILVL